jgi:4-amino-4-deoxy-L-arabinose transferase-like glycosyltransferase
MMARRKHLHWAIALGMLGIVALWIGWIGFLDSDDSLYYYAAARWVDQPPFAGDNHWATRFPVVMSFAALLALFGKGLAAFHIMSIGWFVALITITGLFAKSIAGSRAGWIAAILVATMPTLATFASIVNCDMTEATFLIGGAWLLGSAGKADRPLRHGVYAGLCFGMAALSRETAVLPLIGLFPVFLFGRPVQRKVLLASAAGFAIVLLGEAAFQWAVTGDPLRRYAIAFNHDSHIDRAANMEGNFLVHPAIDPIVVLLINDDFALLFWLGIAAVAAGAWRYLAYGAQQRLAVIAWMGAANFLFVAALTHELVLNPRYFALAALVMVVIVAIWLARMAPQTGFLLLAAAVAANLLAMGLANNHPRWVIDAALIAARDHPNAIILGSHETVERAGLLLKFSGLNNLRAGAPTPGKLYLASDDGPPIHGLAIARYPSPPTILGGMIQDIGLGPILPGRIGKRILAPNPQATLWMVSPDKAHP